jgi:deazaflavin-dependent oxidoreductase (nitroreductase family)
MERIHRADPPRGLRRLLWRFPIRLYQLGLGPLLGPRFMLVTHTGRISGAARHVVVEVVQRDERGYVSASGFGPRADWYRNVLADPRVTLQTGSRRTRATAHPIDVEEGAVIMARYGARHPRTARGLCKLVGFSVDGTEEDFYAVGLHIPFVRFVPDVGMPSH